MAEVNARAATPVARWARRLFDWRNPLARADDRLEAVLLASAIVVAVLGVPFAAALGSEVYADRSAASRDQLLGRRQVDAVLLADAPSSAGGGGLVVGPNVLAEWRLPDGTTRRDEIPVANDVLAGSVVPVWVDASGTGVPAPLTARGAVVDAVAAATGAWTALCAALALLCLVVRLLLDRRRLRRWEQGWCEVEPAWRRLV
ncbi:hypothetical protein JOF41_001889 [Saccharothrix coeruleofusca]|uniref:Rv1733c family protein n=1 Tax=Saccharothrix coeruleofusca TaxID=33919 RepID=UPI001AE65EE6|nr:hypothetical protein [Saccharothrix coeruleofusca]MBP2335711.1 hypothetical protein [Saccharothrix coeruleofusca]